MDDVCLTNLLSISPAENASVAAELCPKPIKVATFNQHIEGPWDPQLLNIAWIVAGDDHRKDFWLFNKTSQNGITTEEQEEMKAVKKYWLEILSTFR